MRLPFKSVGIFVYFFFLLNHSFAQQAGKVEVIKDSRIDSLIAARNNFSRSSGGATAEGFRIQIFSGSERQEALDVQNQFKALRPSVNTYLSYSEPYYKIQVGDFRSRLEAQKLVNEMKKNFPTLIIVPGRINQ